MGEILPLLAIPAQLQADLVVAATLLFLVFATCGFIVSSSAEAGGQTMTAEEPPVAVAGRGWRSPFRAAIIAGLLCGLVLLALSDF